MIVVLNKSADEREMCELRKRLEGMGFGVQALEGSANTVLALVGDSSQLDPGILESLDIVDSVKRIQEQYSKVSRRAQAEDTIIVLENGTKIGGGHFAMMAGPCSVESSEQICVVAQRVKESGATVLRGGAFKPRNSPYSFQGMGKSGLELLLEAKRETGLAVVTELMDLSQLHLYAEVDIIQVGARNMQNTPLLKELGRSDKPVLLKRGASNTIEELLLSAEYIMTNGNAKIILCERGIRTFETATRNTLDLSAIPVLREKTHLPVVVDPSHATGKRRYVSPMSMAAVAAGCDGLLIEVHNNPAEALCDGAQSVGTDTFAKLSENIRSLRALMNSLND